MVVELPGWNPDWYFLMIISTREQLSICLNRICSKILLHSYLTNCRIIVLEKEIFKRFSLYIYFESLLRIVSRVLKYQRCKLLQLWWGQFVVHCQNVFIYKYIDALDKNARTDGRRVSSFKQYLRRILKTLIFSVYKSRKCFA